MSRGKDISGDRLICTRLIGYGRVSRVGGRSGASFISPDLQREEMERRAYGGRHSLIDVLIDLDESGGNMKRPGWLRIMEMARTGAIDGIIVPKLDRFSRNLGEALATIAELDELKVPLISVAEDFDPTTSTGRLVRDFIIRIAQFERERHIETWEDVREKAVERGVHIASRVPTGYTRDPETKRLVPDPVAGKAVHDAFLARASGASLRECAQILMVAGVVTPYDSIFIATSTIAKILKNPVYMGEARSGDLKNPSAHPPLVSPKEWKDAQVSYVLPQTRSIGELPLLSGILRCAGCCYLMKPDTMRGRDGAKLRIYRCRGEHAAGLCRARSSVLAHLIEPYVVAWFFETRANEITMKAVPGETPESDEIRDLLSSAETDLRRWERHMAPDSDDDEDWVTFKVGLKERRNTLGRVTAELAQALAHAGGPVEADDITGLRDIWEELTSDERREILAEGIGAVMLRQGRNVPLPSRVHAIPRSDLPASFPRRGKRLDRVIPFLWPDGEDEVNTWEPAA